MSTEDGRHGRQDGVPHTGSDQHCSLASSDCGLNLLNDQRLCSLLCNPLLLLRSLLLDLHHLLHSFSDDHQVDAEELWLSLHLFW